MKRLLTGLSLLFLTCSSADAQIRAWVGARLIPIDGPEIEQGVLVVNGSRITAVGAMDEVEVPARAETIDASGKVILPGLICTHSHLGGIGAADGSHPIQPGVRVQDSLNPFSAGYRRAVAGGLTTINVMPGSGHLSSGQTIYLKLRLGGDGPRVIDDLFLFDRSEGSAWGTEPMGGLKMANRHELPARQALPRNAWEVGPTRALEVHRGAGVPRQDRRGRGRPGKTAGARSRPRGAR